MISKLIFVITLHILSGQSWAQFYGGGGGDRGTGGYMTQLIGSFMVGQSKPGASFGSFQWQPLQNNEQQYNQYHSEQSHNSLPIMQQHGVSGFYIAPVGFTLETPKQNTPVNQLPNNGHALSTVGASNDNNMQNFYSNLASSAVGMSHGQQITNYNPNSASSAINSPGLFHSSASLGTNEAVGGNNYFSEGIANNPTQYFSPSRSIRFPDVRNTPFFPIGNYVVEPATNQQIGSKETDFLIGHLTNINNYPHNVQPGQQTNGGNRLNELVNAAPAQTSPTISHGNLGVPFTENQFPKSKNPIATHFQSTNVDIGSISQNSVGPSQPFPTFPLAPSKNVEANGAPASAAGPPGPHIDETNSTFDDKQSKPTARENDFLSQVRPFPTLPPTFINAPFGGDLSAYPPPPVVSSKNANVVSPSSNQFEQFDENNTTPGPGRRPAFPTLTPTLTTSPSTPSTLVPESEYSFLNKPIADTDHENDDYGTHELYIDANGIFKIRKPSEDKPVQDSNELIASHQDYHKTSSNNETKIDGTEIIFDDNEQIELNDPIPRVHMSNDGSDEAATHHRDDDDDEDNMTEPHLEPRLHNGLPIFSI